MYLLLLHLFCKIILHSMTWKVYFKIWYGTIKRINTIISFFELINPFKSWSEDIFLYFFIIDTFSTTSVYNSSITEKVMAPYSSTLAWKIPWTEEPSRLQFMGSPRVGYNWATSLPLFTFMHWRRKWQPTPVFLPGESQGQGSLVGCRLWGRTELDTTEAT